MKKSLVTVFTFIFIMCLLQNLHAQNISNRLGGKTDDVGFFIINSDGDTLFRSTGNGKIQFARAFRIEPHVESPNIIGGYEGNYVISGVKGATINGGGLKDKPNFVTDDYGTIGGGYENYAGDNDGTTNYKTWATVGGGIHNFAKGRGSTIGGGGWNETTGEFNTIAGGYVNNATGFMYANISGGTQNTASSSYATVCGGSANTASGNSSVVCGGYGNIAAGEFSFAAGRGAKASHNGCFVWADDWNPSRTIESTAINQFIVRASGGVKLYTNGDHTAGVILNPGSSAWSIVSDRTLKDNIHGVDTKKTLEKLSQLPISRWNYKAQNSQIQHIGPMAQDFYNAFGLGEDDKHISTVDVDGVALAAIQGLYELVQKQAEQIAILQGQVQALQGR